MRSTGSEKFARPKQLGRAGIGTLSAVAATTAVALLGTVAWSATGGAAFTDGSANRRGAVSASMAGAPTDRCRLPGPYELPHGGESVDLDPDDFTHRITNPYWPMRPGTTWRFRETDGQSTQHVKLTVLSRTRDVRGIKARVIHDVVREDGKIIENTFDWYGQDSGGTLWYLGEFTREYENGVPVNTEGSWEYGVDGAQAGVLIPANPKPGCRYRQEYLEGVAEDHAAILAVREDVQVRAGRFRDVLTTGDYVRLEPWVTEHKFFAKGVGPVLAAGLSPSSSREELVRSSLLPR